ncbi:Ig-like domain-containing protein [Pseudoroseomonas cervicalis]|uniref:Ig-like domain-containing protein n=1 Tax=Teichococcus cervicalis TaxID=204525 RepID=UPI0022F1613F|nr:Ig-like domain-containing protein [Pseudoroseomonas cervicalis]WBV44616.1 Ig-like domain-containing protein [Pseudoroseomonas cervicalis]
MATNPTVYFSAYNAANGYELWISDDRGTRLAADIESGTGSSNPRPLGMLNGMLLFSATTADNGQELWALQNGTPVLLKDIAPSTGSSDPASLTVVGGVALFTASAQNGGRDLWVTDGTSQGTVRVLSAASASAGILSELVPVGDGVAFYGSTGFMSGVWYLKPGSSPELLYELSTRPTMVASAEGLVISFASGSLSYGVSIDLSQSPPESYTFAGEEDTGGQPAKLMQAADGSVIAIFIADGSAKIYRSLGQDTTYIGSLSGPALESITGIASGSVDADGFAEFAILARTTTGASLLTTVSGDMVGQTRQVSDGAMQLTAMGDGSYVYVTNFGEGYGAYHTKSPYDVFGYFTKTNGTSIEIQALGDGRVLIFSPDASVIVYNGNTINPYNGNWSPNYSQSSNALIVTTPPVASPTDLVLDTASDTGASSTDGLTNDTTPTVNGVAAPGASVSLYLGQTLLGTATADAQTGAWSITASALPEGTHQLTAVATVDGASSQPSTALSVTIDTTPPAAVAPSAVADVGLGLPGDALTGDSQPVISGTGADPSLVLEIYRDGIYVGAATVSQSGSWSYGETSPLESGSYSYTARQRDAAGNLSDALPYTVTVDLDVPDAPAITAMSQDTAGPGGTTSDRLTADSTPTLSGTAEPGTYVSVYRDGQPVRVVAVDNDGKWSFTESSALLDGAYVYTADALDLAGNRSELSQSFTVTVDTTPPPVPSVTSIYTDTGSSPNDGITKTNKVIVYGAAQPGAVVEVFFDGVSVGTVTSNAVTGAWFLNRTAVTLPDGSYTITARTVDAAGNHSALSGSFTLTVDTQAATPVVQLTQDTGLVGDNITSDTTPTLSGTVEAFSRVQISRDGTVLGTVQADAQGRGATPMAARTGWRRAATTTR